MSGITKPDFVIIGTHYQDGVMVFASDTLTEAELRTITTHEEVVSAQAKEYLPKRHHELEVGFEDYRQATGRTYAEAMSNLFHQWHPHERDQRSIHGRMPKAEMPPLYRGVLR